MDQDFTVDTPLLERMEVPRLLARRCTGEVATTDDESALNQSFPQHTFSYGRKDSSGRKVPQAIAHRGYKAKFPENTLSAFKGAVAVGAQGLETDIHLTRDGVVVLSHDPDLKRCFGEEGKIIDHTWSYLMNVRTTREPHEPMPRLSDLLEYMTTPGVEDVWVMLDIKMDNNSTDVIRLISETIRRTPAAPGRPWHSRIVLGVWAHTYLPLCHDYMPEFPVAYIGYSLLYASHFFSIPNVGFNMLHQVLAGPCGSRFIAKAKRHHRPLYAWTVNDRKAMRWCVQQELDGVITDDPKTFLEVRNSWHPGMREEWSLAELLRLIYINCIAVLVGLLFFWKFRGRGVIRGMVRKRG